MISISLSNVSLVLGARSIFRNLYWEIQHDQKIGLIGPNGAGKSSIFKLIVGEYIAEPGGGVVKAKSVSTGYLPQQPELDPEQRVIDTVMGGNPRILEIESALGEMELKFNDPVIQNNNQALTRWLDEQQKLLDEFERLEGESYPERVRETLLGLGLSVADLGKPVGTLSGGQKKLVGLARILMSRPPVLLLDEPDNHLDLAGKQYLEKLINEYPGAVVIVSHDRYLLDAVVTHITELEDGKLTTFRGDYSSYIQDKQERLARQEELYKIQQRGIARLEAAIKRYALWAKQYDNEKFAKRAKANQARLDRMEKIDRPVLERRQMGLEFNGWRGSNKVLEIVGLRKAFPINGTPPQEVLKDINLLIRHGERVGLIGPNGAGKSVLLRLILDCEKNPNIDMPDLEEYHHQGEIILGPSVKMGYYAQEHETLDLNQTLIDTVRLAHPMSESGAVAFLIRFLFPYRQATQKVSELSGGERSRLQLALLVLSGANFLLLDEPTNNLDIASAEVLEESLADFVGTVLVISHDRYFLDRVVNRIVLLDQGKLSEYYGGYSDFAIESTITRDLG